MPAPGSTAYSSQYSHSFQLKPGQHSNASRPPASAYGVEQFSLKLAPGMNVSNGSRRTSAVQRKESAANGRFRVSQLQDFRDRSAAVRGGRLCAQSGHATVPNIRLQWAMPTLANDLFQDEKSPSIEIGTRLLKRVKFIYRGIIKLEKLLNNVVHDNERHQYRWVKNARSVGMHIPSVRQAASNSGSFKSRVGENLPVCC